MALCYSCDQNAPPLEIHPVESLWTLFISIFHWEKAKSWSVAPSIQSPQEFVSPLWPRCRLQVYTHAYKTIAYERESKDPNAPWLKHISLPHSQLFDIKKRVQNFSRSVRFFPFISRRDIRTRVWRRDMCHAGHYVTNTWYYRVVTNGLSHHPPPRTDSRKNDNFTTITAAALRMLPLSGVVIKYI